MWLSGLSANKKRGSFFYVCQSYLTQIGCEKGKQPLEKGICLGDQSTDVQSSQITFRAGSFYGPESIKMKVKDTVH